MSSLLEQLAQARPELADYRLHVVVRRDPWCLVSAEVGDAADGKQYELHLFRVQKFRRKQAEWSYVEFSGLATRPDGTPPDETILTKMPWIAKAMPPPLLAPPDYVPVRDRPPATMAPGAAGNRLVRLGVDDAPRALIDKALARQTELGLPHGYADYLGRVGLHSICNTLVRVVEPDALEAATGQFRLQNQDPDEWLRSDGPLVLDQEDALECHVWATDMDGNTFLVHPVDPLVTYVLPRDDKTAHRVEGSVYDVLDWVFSTGTITWVNPLLVVTPDAALALSVYGHPCKPKVGFADRLLGRARKEPVGPADAIDRLRELGRHAAECHYEDDDASYQAFYYPEAAVEILVHDEPLGEFDLLHKHAADAGTFMELHCWTDTTPPALVDLVEQLRAVGILFEGVGGS